MLKILILLLLITATPLKADLWIGTGGYVSIPGEDTNDTILVGSVNWNDNKYFTSVNYHNEYEVYRTKIDNHWIVAGGKRFKYEMFYLDLGVAVTSELSITSSSRFLFYESVGIEFDSVRFSITHTSNAGIVAPNEGETYYTVSYKLDL